jgi:mono/diheme cytochrome c family protein
LTDDQVAAVLTYIRNSWGNAAPPVSAAAVGTARRTFTERAD